MRLNAIFFLGFLFSISIVNAQTDFKPGFLINLNHDTLHGEIDYRGDLAMSQVCRFKSNEEVTIYSPNDILEYRFTDGKYFISKMLNDKKVFLEFLIKGQVNIYYLRDEIDDHYYLEKKGEKMVELPYEEGLKRKNGKSYMYRSTKHIGLLNYYMQDAPKFYDRISNMKKPEQKSLVELAEDYHNEVCKDQACVIFEKPTPWIQVVLEATGGLTNYNLIGSNRDKNYVQVGLLGHFWMPRLNEKLYFRTGVLRTSVEFGESTLAFYKFPLQVEYIYPKGFIRPKLAYGVSLYRPSDQTVTATAGLNLHISESFQIGLNVDLDYTPTSFIIIPKDKYSTSYMAGLLYKL